MGKKRKIEEVLDPTTNISLRTVDHFLSIKYTLKRTLSPSIDRDILIKVVSLMNHCRFWASLFLNWNFQVQ